MKNFDRIIRNWAKGDMKLRFHPLLLEQKTKVERDDGMTESVSGHLCRHFAFFPTALIHINFLLICQLFHLFQVEKNSIVKAAFPLYIKTVAGNQTGFCFLVILWAEPFEDAPI